jgi:uncharacterized RDD family membrane protein YckC
MNATASVDQSPDRPAERTITVIGFGQRLVAAVIDAFIVIVLSLILGAIASFLILMIAGIVTPQQSVPTDFVVALCVAVFSVGYYVRSWSKSGQTAGKALMGIKVIGTDGKPVSGGKAFLRYIGYIVSGIVISLGFLWITFDRKRQGWHDKIAGTYVVFVEEKFSDGERLKFVTSDDPSRKWLWIVLWIVGAILLPFGLFGGVWLLGPAVSRLVANILGLS